MLNLFLSLVFFFFMLDDYLLTLTTLQYSVVFFLDANENEKERNAERFSSSIVKTTAFFFFFLSMLLFGVQITYGGPFPFFFLCWPAVSFPLCLVLWIAPLRSWRLCWRHLFSFFFSYFRIPFLYYSSVCVGASKMLWTFLVPFPDTCPTVHHLSCVSFRCFFQSCLVIVVPSPFFLFCLFAFTVKKA